MEFYRRRRVCPRLGRRPLDRPHGLRIDPDDNIWTTDVAGHVVCKLSPKGRIMMVLGVRGRPGEWHDFGHLRLFNEPNDLVFADRRHGRAPGPRQGPSQVLMFDRDGNSQDLGQAARARASSTCRIRS